MFDELLALSSVQIPKDWHLFTGLAWQSIPSLRLIGPFGYLLKGLLPCMCPDMIVESSSTSKGPTAIATLERSVTGMGDYMVP